MPPMTGSSFISGKTPRDRNSFVQFFHVFRVPTVLPKSLSRYCSVPSKRSPCIIHRRLILLLHFTILLPHARAERWKCSHSKRDAKSRMGGHKAWPLLLDCKDRHCSECWGIGLAKFASLMIYAGLRYADRTMLHDPTSSIA